MDCVISDNWAARTVKSRARSITPIGEIDRRRRDVVIEPRPRKRHRELAGFRLQSNARAADIGSDDNATFIGGTTRRRMVAALRPSLEIPGSIGDRDFASVFLSLWNDAGFTCCPRQRTVAVDFTIRIGFPSTFLFNDSCAVNYADFILHGRFSLRILVSRL